VKEKCHNIPEPLPSGEGPEFKPSTTKRKKKKENMYLPGDGGAGCFSVLREATMEEVVVFIRPFIV
jgi:hypothetical protein